VYICNVISNEAGNELLKIMNTNQILSLKKSNCNWVETKISETMETINYELPNILSSRYSSDTVSNELTNLSALKDALLIMQMNVYKAYEESGKQVDYNTFKEEFLYNS